jgi:chromosome partitioning protein
MTYFITVANQKGGVAKTTTVASLGAALAKNNFSVLLIDLDAQANLTMSFGFNPTLQRQSITDVLLQAHSLLAVAQPTYLSGLHLVPGSSTMGMAERFLPIRKEYHLLLQSILNVPLPYDYVLFDCPPSMGAITINALHASNLLIIPSQAEYFSIAALRSMMEIIRQVRSQGNSGLVYRILLTMYDGRNRIHQNLREQLHSTFREGLFQTVVGVDTKLRESSAAGLSISDYHPKSRAALQYQFLAQEVVEHVHEYVDQLI